jgi:hypothetical protein
LSCLTVRKKDINDVSVKAFLQAKRDLLCVIRVGNLPWRLDIPDVLRLREKTSQSTRRKRRERTTTDFPQIAADILKPMDGGINLSPEEIMGRNTGTSGAQAISVSGIVQLRTATG